MVKNALNVAIAGLNLTLSRKTRRQYNGFKKTLGYTVSQEKWLKLDLYHPGKTYAPVPLIVWIHGGAWKMGSRKDIEPGIIKQLDRGYGIASLDYSLSGNAQWPVQAHEIKAGIRFLRANAKDLGIHPDCFIAAGMSAGGHLASIAGVTSHTSHLEGALGHHNESSHVHGVVSWYGPSDFLHMGDLGIVDHDKPNSPESQLIGAPIQSAKQQVQTANPITYIHDNVPPFYLAHGTWDRFVNPNQSQLLAESLKSNNTDVTYKSLKGYAHADFRFNAREHFKHVEKFIDNVRKNTIGA